MPTRGEMELGMQRDRKKWNVSPDHGKSCQLGKAGPGDTEATRV